LGGIIDADSDRDLGPMRCSRTLDEFNRDRPDPHQPPAILRLVNTCSLAFI